jgi:tetratricopeptide (TPR) repeat protein
MRSALAVQPDHRGALFKLAFFLERKKEYAEAACVYTACLAVPPVQGRADVYAHRSACRRQLGQTEAADADLAVALAIEKDSALSQGSLGAALDNQERYADEVTVLRRRLALETKPVQVHLLLGIALGRLGREAEAAAEFRRAIEVAADDAESLIRLGKGLDRASRFAEAEDAFRKAIELKPGDVGAYHNLAHRYQDAGRLPEAIALFEQSLAKEKARPGSGESSKTEEYMYCLAVAYQDAGRFDQAEPLLVERLDRARSTNPPQSPDTAARLAELGRNRLLQRQYTTAEPLLRECLAIRTEKLPDDWLRFNAMSMLGGSLLGQGKYAEAEPLLLQGYEGMKQREAKIPAAGKRRLPEAVERIVHLYDTTGRAEQARAWRAKLPADPKPDP